MNNGRHFIKTPKKLAQKKRQTDGYFMLLLDYARTSFRVFESHLRIVVGLDEDDFQLIKKQYSSIFILYQAPLGIYSIKDTSEAISPWQSMKGPCTLNMMILASKQNVFEPVLLELLEP